jgi:hypothetical protein
MPQPGERPEAILRDDVTVADVAEALEHPGERALPIRLNELMLAVIAPAGPRLVAVLLYRRDDSFVWLVLRAQSAETGELAQRNKGMGA